MYEVVNYAFYYWLSAISAVLFLIPWQALPSFFRQKHQSLIWFTHYRLLQVGEIAEQPGFRWLLRLLLAISGSRGAANHVKIPFLTTACPDFGYFRDKRWRKSLQNVFFDDPLSDFWPFQGQGVLQMPTKCLFRWPLIRLFAISGISGNCHVPPERNVGG